MNILSKQRLTAKVITTTLFLALGTKLFSTEAWAASATLTLSPSSSTYEVGESFEIGVMLDTNGGRTSGVDVILFYDTSKIEAQEIVTGSIFASYPYQNINEQEGIIEISGLMIIEGEPFSGSGTFATLQLKALSTGTATITFDFTPGGRNDSNIADYDSQEDLLSDVTNGNYTIESSAPTPTSTPTPTPQPAPPPTFTPTPAPAAEPTATPTPEPAATPTPTPTSAPGVKKGDINQDNKVDIFDLSHLLSKWGKTDNIGSVDLNRDGKVDIFDLSVLLSNWGK